MPEKQISHLKDHIGFWMRSVSNNVSHTFARRLEETGVTVAEWVILREMFENGDVTSPSVIADLTGLTRGAISKLMTRLLDKDLIARDESRVDRRYQEIKLTMAAKKLVPMLAKIADENDEKFFSVLTCEERQLLKTLLIKLAERHRFDHMPIE